MSYMTYVLIISQLSWCAEFRRGLQRGSWCGV